MAAAKSMILMIMIASLASGILAVLLALAVDRTGQMLVISAPGFIIGGFFALKYAMYDKSKAKEEEHRRNRNRHKH